MRILMLDMVIWFDWIVVAHKRLEREAAEQCLGY
jgi:hypothetical protein